MRDSGSMVAFYRSMGFDVAEHRAVVSVYAGSQMINFHRPATWQRDGFSLRAPAAEPPCGDLCFVWEGSADSLRTLLERAGAAIEEGPVTRNGGRRDDGTSVYTRDPDGNLVEFISYDR
jgi:catechol 2,3-dioxygenase-like lactoylglutathione lyase family enzyme